MVLWCAEDMACIIMSLVHFVFLQCMFQTKGDVSVSIAEPSHIVQYSQLTSLQLIFLIIVKLLTSDFVLSFCIYRNCTSVCEHGKVLCHLT